MGWSTTAAGHRHAVLWQAGTIIDLGRGECERSARPRGQIVGWSATPTGLRRAVRWDSTRPPQVVRGLDAELNLAAKCTSTNADGTFTVSGVLAITNQSERRQTLRIGSVTANVLGKIGCSDTHLAPLTTTDTTLTNDVPGLVLAPKETGSIPYRTTFRPEAYREFVLDVQVTLETEGGTGHAATPRADREEFARCRSLSSASSPMHHSLDQSDEHRSHARGVCATQAARGKQRKRAAHVIVA